MRRSRSSARSSQRPALTPENTVGTARVSSTRAVRGGRRDVVLDLVEETLDQEVDVNAVHDAFAVLLMRLHRRRTSSEAAVT